MTLTNKLENLEVLDCEIKNGEMVFVKVKFRNKPPQSFVFTIDEWRALRKLQNGMFYTEPV